MYLCTLQVHSDVESNTAFHRLLSLVAGNAFDRESRFDGRAVTQLSYHRNVMADESKSIMQDAPD